MAFIEQLSPYHYRVKPGFVPGMAVPGVFYVNDRLKGLLFEELQAGLPVILCKIPAVASLRCLCAASLFEAGPVL